LIFVGVFLAAAVAVAMDDAAARRRIGDLASKRASEASSLAAQQEGSTAGAAPRVDKVCGFSPCGLPLPCE
jgi:hypothetical protein